VSVSVLIDEKGEACPVHGMASRLGCRDPDFDLPAYAVRNLGCIHIRPQMGGTRVALRAGNFSLITLTGALLHLIERQPTRIMLALLGEDGWAYEIYTSVGSFAERAEAVAAGEPIGQCTPWTAAGRDLESLAEPGFATVQPLVRLWRANRGRLPGDFAAALSALGLARRSVVVRQPAGSSRLVFEHFGTGIKMMRPCECLMAVGRDIDDVPDRAYASWVAESYAETIASRRPRLDSVRASIRTSEAATIRVRYDRLLVPWRRGDDMYVFGISMRRELSILA
jgi:hypothetical protein